MPVTLLSILTAAYLQLRTCLHELCCLFTLIILRTIIEISELMHHFVPHEMVPAITVGHKMRVNSITYYVINNLY